MHKPVIDNGAVNGHLDGLLSVHDKSPADALGDVTKTDLPRNVVLAAGITFGLMALLTFGPYLYHQIVPKADPNAEKPAVAEQAAPAPAPTAATTKAQPKSDDPLTPPVPDPLASGPATKGATPRDPVLDKLDIGQTKTTDPKKNPLDKTNDDLLKDIK